MLHFCTLFDINYLSRGITLYRSLEKVCTSFHLYVFAFDEPTRQFFSSNKASFPHITMVSLKEFEDDALLRVKPSRSAAEYCWTSTPSTLLFCLEQFKPDHCTYLDADMFFYHDPQVLVDEMGDKSVLISEHRYTPAYDQSSYSGTYCVQFMCFKNTADGMTVLRWWRERCLEWCYARLEDGKFGDQKYLDDWTTRFSSIHVMQHPGGGVAPWNVQQFDITKDLQLIEKKSDARYPLVFFHYHGLKFYKDDKVSLCGSLYELELSVREHLYFPYIRNLLSTSAGIKPMGLKENSEGANTQSPSGSMQLFKFWKETALQIKKGKLSPFHLKNFNFSLHKHIYPLDQFL
jgi:hypothetical protein